MTEGAEAGRSAIARYIVGRLGEVDAKLGGLTDNHLKFLVFFSNEYFGVENSNLVIDVPNRRLTVTPWKRCKMSFGRYEWIKWKWRLWRKRDERDLPAYLGLEGWTIRFERTPPREEQDVNEPTG